MTNGLFFYCQSQKTKLRKIQEMPKDSKWGHSYALIAALALYLLIVAIFASSYTKSFFSFGDGIAYVGKAQETLGLSNDGIADFLKKNAHVRTDAIPEVSLNDRLREHQLLAYGLKVLKDLNAGFLPGYVAGYFLPASENFLNYYIGQSAIYFLALLLVYLYLRTREQIDRAVLRNVFVASFLAPYMLVIGAYPTKYLVVYVALLFSINLLYVATVTKNNRDVLMFFGSLLILLLLKFQIAFLLAALSLVVLWLRTRKSVFAVVLLIGVGSMLFGMDYFVKLYLSQSNDGDGRKFELLYNNFAARLVIKYVMDAFGEFPWAGFSTHRNMAIAITGVLAPLFIIFQACNFAMNSAGVDKIKNLHYESFVGWIALVLSLSVFWGKTGFLEYLAIFFPLIGIRVERSKIALPLLVSVLTFLTIIFAKAMWR